MAIGEPHCASRVVQYGLDLGALISGEVFVFEVFCVLELRAYTW